jgi:4-amino-4-deoxy-L-arabinose transferase-like glycosyltransferase
MNRPEDTPELRFSPSHVWALLGCALLIRLAWIGVGPELIENEGGYFARVAENILSGRGFISPYGAADTMYSLGYSVLIAALSFFVHDAELSGRLISALAGTGIVAAVYLIANALYGHRAALLGGVLAAVSPLLVGYAGAVYSETPYMCCVMLGVYFGLRTIEFSAYRNAIFTGLWFGLAYLIRPEGIAYLGLAIVAVAVAAAVKRVDWRRAAATSGAVLVTGIVVAAPYVAYLWHVTGEVRLEGKNLINHTIIKRMETGMNYNAAAWGIDANLDEQGPLLNPVPFATHSPYPVSAATLLAGIPQRIVHNTSLLLQQFLPSFSYGSPTVLALLVLGFFRRTWDRARLGKELFVGLMASWAVAISLLAHVIWFRYTLPLFPFLLVWAGNGARELGDWSLQTLRDLSGNIAPKRLAIVRWSSHAALTIVVGSAVLFGWMGTKYVAEITQGFNEHKVLKEAGLWLHERDAGPKLIMDVSTQVAFYAQGDFGGLPYASSELALKYLETKKRPDYIVVWSGSVEKRPYLAEWLKHGIPSPHAELIHRIDNGGDDALVLYRWN